MCGNILTPEIVIYIISLISIADGQKYFDLAYGVKGRHTVYPGCDQWCVSKQTDLRE